MNSVNNLMNKKILSVLVGVVILGFWWVEVRPVTVRQGCYDIAVETFGIDKNETDLRMIARSYDSWLPAYNTCLKNRGI